GPESGSGRKEDGETGALAGSGIDADLSVVGANDLLDHRQAQSAPPLLGSEKGLEQAGPDLRGDSRSVVADDQRRLSFHGAHDHLDGRALPGLARSAGHGLRGVEEKVQ